MSRDLFRKGVYPPVDLLSSLSRLMSKGVGRGLTRDDHKSMSNQCYANLAEVEKLRALISIIGEEGLTETDKRYLEWANRFEREFINQDENERRGIKQSLEKAWELLSIIPEERLKRIEKDLMKRYMRGE